jgi:serine/threonine-protein phosphatase 2A regulatory subunit B'
MLVPVIVDLAENHWHKILQESLVALKTILKEIDSFTFQESLEMKGEEKKRFAIKQYDADRKELDSKWDKIDKCIKDLDPTYVKPKVPFKPDALICDYNELYKKIYDKEKYINL